MGKIFLRKALKLYNYSAFIKFDYDAEIISFIHNNFNERYWHKDLKLWEISLTEYRKFTRRFKDFIIVNEIEEPQENKKVKNKLSLPSDFTFVTKPFQHQFETVCEGQKRFQFLLGDEPGCGKTKQIIDIARLHKFLGNIKHCLIICGINNSKWNWINEIKIHSKEKYILLGSRQRKNGNYYDGSNLDKIEDIKNIKDELFIVTNIQSLRDPKIVEQLQKVNFEMIALDESHKCNNPQADQTKGFLKLDSKIKIAMTGTPVLNKPIDLYVTLKWLGKENHNFSIFKNHYCVMGGFGGYQIVAYKNMKELQERVDEIQIRRKLNDIKEMPPLIYKNQILEMTKEQAQIYNNARDGIIQNIDKIITNPNPLTDFIRLRQATSFPSLLAPNTAMGIKFEKILEIMNQAVENNKKVLIYSNWVEVIKPLQKLLEKYNPAMIIGGMKDVESQKRKLFNDESCRCMIGTIGAMGTSHNLPAASWVIFIDLPWTAADMKQAIDRVRRIEGTTEKTIVYNLICKNTIDEKVKNIVEEKQEYAEFLVDGKINFSNKRRLVEFLLS